MGRFESRNFENLVTYAESSENFPSLYETKMEIFFFSYYFCDAIIVSNLRLSDRTTIVRNLQFFTPEFSHWKSYETRIFINSSNIIVIFTSKN